MTPQSNFMVVAPIRPGRAGELRELLATMNAKPGMANPANELVPFGQFATLHVARLIVLDDQTVTDLVPPGEAPLERPPYLAFFGDYDGEEDEMLMALAGRAPWGLRRIFGFCEGFDEGTPLLDWMRQNSVVPAVQYINWVGRTVCQVGEEAQLRKVLRAELAKAPPTAAETPRQTRARLVDAVAKAGLRLSAPKPTPLEWRVRKFLHAIWALVAGTAGILLFIPYSPIFFWQLRRREKTDQEYTPRPSHAHLANLVEREDHDVSNSFSAFGSLKPGLFRLLLIRSIFWVLANATRHIYTRGKLARVGTIHFARWVFFDDRRRVFFGSNYDGSLDSYMDDFINKVAYGLNLAFSNGVGYPHTDWLINGGAKDEEKFKDYIRRHQHPSDVWYKAYPGLTTFDLARNSRIRKGFERARMNDDEIRQWLELI